MWTEKLDIVAIIHEMSKYHGSSTIILLTKIFFYRFSFDNFSSNIFILYNKIL